MMSSSRAKFNHQKFARPSTAVASLHRTSGSQKSLIPKFRSLSQPPSTHSIKDPSTSVSYDIEKWRPKKSTATEIDEEAARDNSVKSDEFKDCLDVKPSQEMHSNSCELWRTHLMNRNTKQHTGLSLQLRGMSRRNSPSGIPISNSLKSNKVSPRPLQGPVTGMPKNTNVISVEARIANKRSFELFVAKKRRFDRLRKDVLDKQRQMLELYKLLQPLKKKLDENGKPVILETFKLIECEELLAGQKRLDLSAGGEAIVHQVNLDPDAVVTPGKTDTPQSFIDLCRTLIEKRTHLITLLDWSLDPQMNIDMLKFEIEQIKKESDTFNTQFKEALQSRECPNRPADNDESNQVKDLHGTRHVQKEESTDDEVRKLKDKVLQLEKHIESEKRKNQHEQEKYKTCEITLKTFKSKIKDFDNNKLHYETKITQLSQECRNSQMKYKQLEKNFEREVSELNKCRHLDKSVIERLNKDKLTFETRLRTSDEIQEAMKATLEDRQCEVTKELERTRNEAEISQNEVIQLRKECELMRSQINSLEVRTQQAADVMVRRQHHSDSLEGDRECQLQTEIVAQRASIKALQDKIEANTKEKLRFVRTIEQLNCAPSNMNDTIIKTLVKKEEDITRYNVVLKQNEDLICRQKLEITNLQSRLNEMLPCSSQATGLELATRVTTEVNEFVLALENDNKVVSYEFELTKKNETIANLENMMKVREGLIGVIKAKKDELKMENSSLSVYSKEIRAYVCQFKVALMEKIEIIQEQQSMIDNKQNELFKLQKRVHDLEQKLIISNDRRYKLQESLTAERKEPQPEIKPETSQVEDPQTQSQHTSLK